MWSFGYISGQDLRFELSGLVVDRQFSIFTSQVVLPSTFRLFLAIGISEPLSSNACASALRKICEDASVVIYEPSNLEILMWIGEVSCSCAYIGVNNWMIILRVELYDANFCINFCWYHTFSLHVLIFMSYPVQFFYVMWIEPKKMLCVVNGRSLWNCFHTISSNFPDQSIWYLSQISDLIMDSLWAIYVILVFVGPREVAFIIGRWGRSYAGNKFGPWFCSQSRTKEQLIG